MIYLLVAFFIFWLIIVALARNGKGGTLGAKIRTSDWQAWNYAVEDKQRELEQLKSIEPKL
ncbi:MAG: hypothetical protein WC346_02900 [Methanogenium sp.]|jgi:hypothetical protein